MKVIPDFKELRIYVEKPKGETYNFKPLLTVLYKDFLRKADDNYWFFLCYTSHLKLRLTNKVLLEMIKNWCKRRKLKFSIEPYDEITDCGQVVTDYWENFITIFHHQSIITISEMIRDNSRTKEEAMDRFVHIPLNMRGFSYAEEAYYMSTWALKRMQIAGYAAVKDDKASK